MVLKVWMLFFCAIVLVTAPGSSLPVNDVADDTSVTAKIDQPKVKIDKSKDNDALSKEFNEFMNDIEKVITDIYLDDFNTTLQKLIQNFPEIKEFEDGVKFMLNFVEEIKKNTTLDDILQILNSPLIKDHLEQEYRSMGDVPRNLPSFLIDSLLNFVIKFGLKIVCELFVPRISTEIVPSEEDSDEIISFVKMGLKYACNKVRTRSSDEMEPKDVYSNNNTASTVANISKTTLKNIKKREQKQTHFTKKRSLSTATKVPEIPKNMSVHEMTTAKNNLKPETQKVTKALKKRAPAIYEDQKIPIIFHSNEYKIAIENEQSKILNQQRQKILQEILALGTNPTAV